MKLCVLNRCCGGGGNLGNHIYVAQRFKNFIGRLALLLGLLAGAFSGPASRAQEVEWARSAGGISIDIGHGIAVDPVGNSYVTGEFLGTATFGPFTITSAGPGDVFVAKYDPSGNVLWVRAAGGTFSSLGIDIGIDAAGNSYVTGVSLVRQPSARSRSPVPVFSVPPISLWPNTTLTATWSGLPRPGGHRTIRALLSPSTPPTIAT